MEQRQKVIVLIRILEFIYADNHHSTKELEFAETVADTFNIEKEEYQEIFEFVKAQEKNLPKYENHLCINSINSIQNDEETKRIISDGLIGEVSILRVKSVKTYFVRYFGNHELFLNGQLMTPKSIKVLRQGSSIKNSRINPIY